MKALAAQIEDCREALFAIVNSLGAALPLTPEVKATLGTLVDSSIEYSRAQVYGAPNEPT
jgi:hypothetical protein